MMFRGRRVQPKSDTPVGRGFHGFQSERLAVALVVAAAIGVTIVGVEWQRRGDDDFSFLRSGVHAFRFPGIPRWFGFWFQAPCPTSSATRAQLWLEMKSTGVPVLSIGVVIALGIPVLLSASNAYRWDLPILTASLSLVPLAAVALAPWSFGLIRHR